jgi:hypothetical protein
MQEVWVSAVEGALHSAGRAGGCLWPCGKNGEKKTGGTEGGEARRDWLGTSDGPIDDEPSRLAVWHKMAAEGWWCVRVPVAKHFESSLPGPGPSHGRSQAMSPLPQKGLSS